MDEWVRVPFEVEKKFDGLRVDRFLAQRLASYSRSRVQKILSSARVQKGERIIRASTKVYAGDKITIAYARKAEAPLPPDFKVPVLYEDDALVIVDKPAGLLSHPTDKIVLRTVVGALRQSRPDLKKCHLLHRLDRETSGVLALAKDPETARAWSGSMVRREIQKEYSAFLLGTPQPPRGAIDAPIGRRQGDLKIQQAVHVPGAVAASTEYAVVEAFVQFSFVRAFPKTGRLHQIRVHFSSIGHPVLGDPLYTGDGDVFRRMIGGAMTGDDRLALRFGRVALHASAISFLHPRTRSILRVEAPLPDDMRIFLAAARSATLLVE